MTFLYVIITLFGLIIGSFLTVVITRYPAMLKIQWQNECCEFLDLPQNQNPQKISLAKPRSYCPQCKTQIKFYHNIPLISFLLLRGRCAYCKTKISWLYPTIEIISAITSVVIFWHFGPTLQMIAALLFTYILIALSFIDLNHKLLPDNLTLTTLWIGLILNTTNLFTPLNNAVLATVIGYLLLWLSAWLFLKFRHKQGMGHGDFKMIAMVGAWFGINAMLNTVLIAVIIGTITSLILIILKKISWQRAVPFGPFIAIASWTTMLTGPFIINWIQ